MRLSFTLLKSAGRLTNLWHSLFFEVRTLEEQRITIFARKLHLRRFRYASEIRGWWSFEMFVWIFERFCSLQMGRVNHVLIWGGKITKALCHFGVIHAILRIPEVAEIVEFLWKVVIKIFLEWILIFILFSLLLSFLF